MKNLHGSRGIKLNDQNQNNGSSHQSNDELRSEIKELQQIMQYFFYARLDLSGMFGPVLI